MFSLGKVILTLAVIAGVVLLYRVIGARNAKVASEKKKKGADALDLTKCAVCGHFVEAGAGACERADCPR